MIHFPFTTYAAVFWWFVLERVWKVTLTSVPLTVSQQSVVKDISQLCGPETLPLWIFFFCMILLLWLSLGCSLRVTLSLWVMLGIWHPASRHCISKGTMHPLSHLALYIETMQLSMSTVHRITAAGQRLIVSVKYYQVRGKKVFVRLHDESFLSENVQCLHICLLTILNGSMHDENFHNFMWSIIHVWLFFTRVFSLLRIDAHRVRSYSVSCSLLVNTVSFS